jgi:2OG-Fe(II) oxygenase superfamily
MLTLPDRLLRLSGDADGWRTDYRQAKPWPHLVMENVIDPGVAAEIAAVAEAAPPAILVRESSRRVKKDAAPDFRSLGANAERLFEELGDPAFVAFLSDMTRVGGLQADPSLYNAGVFITQRGGWQRVHEDFPRHPGTGLWNRVAVLLYCSEWSAEWGGELELWPMDMSRREETVEPAPGRLVVFETHSGTRHGVAEVAAAAEHPRVVVATRYYSLERPPNPPGGVLVRSFRRPTERRRDVLPTFSEARDYLHSQFRGSRPPG